MKYAIRHTYNIHNKETEWVRRIHTAKFKDRDKTPHIDHTKLLSEAKLYNTKKEACAVMLLISTRECPASVHEIDDKELFEARLKGI